MSKVLLEEKETGIRLIVEAIDAGEILAHGKHIELARAHYGLPVAPDSPPGTKGAVKNEQDVVWELNEQMKTPPPSSAQEKPAVKEKK